MKPYYDHAGIQIHHGDCREILPGLRADALVTDPPFGISFGRASWSDKPEDYPEMVRWLVDESHRAVDGWCFAFQAMLNVGRFHEWFPLGFRIFAACKNFAQMRPTDVQFSWDPVVFWHTSEPGKRHRSDAGVVTRDWHVGDVAGALTRPVGHPCPRPLDTMRHIVLIGSREKQTVLDPFMGSGTTLVAAKLEGRRAIGIEIEERYCEIAAKRLAQEVFDFG
jgi:site-specific DNA-methyltransferase (adenine-specific)